MAHERAFGAARRPGRVHDRRSVGRVTAGQRRGRRVERFGVHRRDLRVAEQRDARLEVVDDVAQLGLGQRRVHGGRERTRVHRGEPRFDRADAVAAADEHAVAARDAAVEQPRRARATACAAVSRERAALGRRRRNGAAPKRSAAACTKSRDRGEPRRSEHFSHVVSEGSRTAKRPEAEAPGRRADGITRPGQISGRTCSCRRGTSR